MQELLAEEVSALLGRGRYERRAVVDAAPGYRNGHRRPRRLALTSGTVTLRRPRVRGLEARFASRILPLFKRRTREVGERLLQLCLQGLAEGDFQLALRGLLGEGAPLSSSSIARLKASWQVEYEAFQRPVHGLELLYLWVDGVYVKAGLERDKAAVLVAIGAVRGGRKVVLAVPPGYRESTDTWAALLRDLKARGLAAPRLAVGDGHLGIWGALAHVYPEAEEQRGWNHRLSNVLAKLPQRRQAEARRRLSPIPYAGTRAEAERWKRGFQRWCQDRGLGDVAALLDHDWERLVTFYRFPKANWKHLRTTNVIESPFAAVRVRTTVAKRYKRVANATAVIWKTLLLAERRFRRLDAPQLLSEVAEGAIYADGERVRSPSEEAAA